MAMQTQPPVLWMRMLSFAGRRKGTPFLTACNLPVYKKELNDKCDHPDGYQDLPGENVLSICSFVYVVAVKRASPFTSLYQLIKSVLSFQLIKISISAGNRHLRLKGIKAGIQPEV